MITISTSTGTFSGDPNGIFIDIDVTVLGNGLVINGVYSNYGVIYPVTGSFTIPAPSTTLTTYVSVQVTNAGVVQMYTNTTAMPSLQSGNLIQIYSETIPANAANAEGFIIATEPSI